MCCLGLIAASQVGVLNDVYSRLMSEARAGERERDRRTGKPLSNNHINKVEACKTAPAKRSQCTLSLHPFYLEDDLSFLKRIAASSADLRQSPEAL